MSKDSYRDDRVYLMTMSIAKKLLREGTITEESYHDFNIKMQQKYGAKFSVLFADITPDNP